MYTSIKIKSKNLQGLSARTIVYYNDENHIITIQVIMIVPNEFELDNFKLERQLTNHRVISNLLNFKLSSSIELVNSLSSIFTSIMRSNKIYHTDEFTKYANNINYETRIK